jgi:hypothetical protein
VSHSSRSGNIVGPYSFLASEAPVYRTGIIVCMASRAAEILVILALRVCFVLPNKSRDKKFAAGDEAYNPATLVYADMTDKQNKHFRYIGESRAHGAERGAAGGACE